MKFLSRNERERLTDGMLSLVLLKACVSDDGKTVGDRLKVARLLFLATHDLFSRQNKAFNFSFYRYHHGPFTTELYETWEELGWMGFLELEPGAAGRLKLTDEGVAGAERYEQRLLQLGNHSIIQTFKRISDSYAQLSTDEILQKVYSMEIAPLGWREPVNLRQTPQGSYFTAILDEKEAKLSLIIDDDIVGEFFAESPAAQKSKEKAGAAYEEIYASALRGVRAARAGLPATEVSLREMRQNLEGRNG